MAGPIKIAILANGTQAKREIASVNGSLGKIGGGLGRTAAALGFAGLTAGAVGFAKSAIETEKKFSTSMRLIQASTHASGEEIKQLNDLAIKLGADTSFSANDAADAMLELAKAGLSTKTIMGGGVAGTLTLAAAGGTDLATASTIASNAMNTFNLRGRDMAKVAAALAGGANASSASVESLGQGLQQVGPGATNAGLSLQETVAALSAFDAAGIKGSDAGTSLKTMLTRLVPQTDKAQSAMEDLGLKFTDADGKFVSLTNVAEQLQRGLGKLSDEQRTTALNTIFGSDATRAATVLMKEGAGGIRGYIKATNDQAAAQKMANARMSGTEGALERLSGSIETAKLRLGQELAPVVIKVADNIGDKLVPAMEHIIDGAKDVGRAVEPALSSAIKALSHLAGEGDAAGSVFNDTFLPALSATADIVAGAIDLIDSLPGPVKEFGTQVAFAALVLPRLNSALATAQTRLAGFTSGMTTASGRTAFFTSQLKTVAGVGGILALTTGLQGAAKEGASFGDVLGGVAGGAGIGAMFGPIGALVGAGVGGGLTALVGAFSDTEEEARQTRLELLKTQGFKNASEDADTLRDSLSGVVNAYGKVTRAAVESSFTGKDGLEPDIAQLRSLGVSMDTIVSATLGQRDAINIVNSAYAKHRRQLETSLGFAKSQWDEAKDGALDYVDASGQVIKNGQHLDNDAMDIYRKQWEDARDALTAYDDQQDVFKKRIEENTGAIADHNQIVGELADKLGISIRQYRQWPQEVRTRFEADGLVQTNQDALRLIGQYKGLQKFGRIKTLVDAPGVQLTYRDVLKLQQRYKLNPKQVKTLFRQEKIGTNIRDIARLTKLYRANPDEIRTLIKAADLPFTVKQVKGYQKQLDDVGRQKPTPQFRADFKRFDAAGKHVEQRLHELDTAPPATPRVDLNTNDADAKRRALITANHNIPDETVNIWIVTHRKNSSGGSGGGADLGDGVPKLLLGDTTSLTADAERAGITAGRALMRGVEKGSHDGKGKGLLAQILASVVGGSDGVNAAIDKINKLIEQRTKDDKAGNARQKQILKGLRDEYEALKRNAKAQDEINRKLEKARAHLQEVKQWVDQVKQSFIDTGNVTQLGILDDGTVSGTLLIDQLQQQVSQADRFADIIRQLTDGAGIDINDTTLQQLLQAGPEAGLATAEALLSGGDAAIAQINQLTQHLAQTGQQLGAQMSDQFFDVGLHAAQGLVDGLLAQQDKLDKIAKHLAHVLANAVKHALKIHSPSQVFRDIGDQTMKGLALGLDETYARRAGTATAQALVEGFGTPALNAYTRSRTDGSGFETLRIRLSAEQVSQLRRGKEAIVDVQVGRSSGARQYAVGPR